MTSTALRVANRGRYGLSAAALGAVAWVVLPWLPADSTPGQFSLEHVFLFLPLVVAPLSYVLLSRLMYEDGSRSQSAFRIVAMVQPVAAALATVAFFLPAGSLAGWLAAPWLAVAVATAVCGLSRIRRGAGIHFSNVNLIAAHVFLPAAAVWLLLSRLGVTPPNFSPLRVVLAAVHFHYGGFALQILIGATGRRLPTSLRRMGTLHRIAAIGALFGIPMIAAGHLLAVDSLKFAGVSVQVLVSLSLAVTMAAVAIHASRSAPRLLLLTAAASIAVGMAIAGIYGAGELAGTPWMEVPQMVIVHGLLNALGFALCGMAGHLLASNG